MSLVTKQVRDLIKAFNRLAQTAIEGTDNEISLRFLLQFDSVLHFKRILASAAFSESWLALKDAHHEYLPNASNFALEDQTLFSFMQSFHPLATLEMKVLEIETRDAILDVFVLLMEFSKVEQSLPDSLKPKYSALKQLALKESALCVY